MNRTQKFMMLFTGIVICIIIITALVTTQVVCDRSDAEIGYFQCYNVIDYGVCEIEEKEYKFNNLQYENLKQNGVWFNITEE